MKLALDSKLDSSAVSELPFGWNLTRFLAPSLGPFCYAKGLQPARRSWLRNVWHDGRHGRAGLHARTVNGQKLRQRAEARTDENDS